MDGLEIEQGVEMRRVGTVPGANRVTGQKVDAQDTAIIGQIAILAEEEVFSLHESCIGETAEGLSVEPEDPSLYMHDVFRELKSLVEMSMGQFPERHDVVCASEFRGTCYGSLTAQEAREFPMPFRIH